MMKIAILAVLAVTAVYASPRPDDEYKSRLDNINVDEVLKNSRLVDSFIKCFLEKGKCTPDGKAIKEQVHTLLPEILETNCAKCTEDQKTKVRKVLKYMHTNKRAEYDEFLNKYDGNKELRTKYKEKYGDVVKEEGFADIFD